MSRTILSRMVICISVMVIIVLTGCEGDQGPQGEIGPTGPAGPQGEPGEITPFVTGLIRAPFFDAGALDVYGTADIVISKIPSLPAVRVNGFIIGQSLYSTGDGLVFYSTNVPVTAGDPATLTVDYLSASGDSMRASTSLNIPGDFAVFPDSVTTGQSDTLRLDWTPSAGADGYYVLIGTRVEYADTLGKVYRHVFDLDTIVTDTFFEMSAAPFFPNGIDPGLYLGSQYSNAYAHVSAVSGPVFPEDPQNVTGDGYGFVYGENCGPLIDLELEMPVTVSKMSVGPDVGGRLLDHLLDLHSK